MDNWELLLNVSWPHERCRVGWEILNPTEENDYTTITIDLFIISFIFNFD